MLGLDAQSRPRACPFSRCTRRSVDRPRSRSRKSAVHEQRPSVKLRATIQEAAQEVTVTVERANRNTRRLYASVNVAAPVEVVWRALTDYDGLADFIPGLSENRCLARRPGGAQLLQVGEQDIALGAKFRATVVLDIQEYKAGVPESLCSSSSNGVGNAQGRQIFPEPRTGNCQAQCQDIAFSMVKGDFTAFRGIWRMQTLAAQNTLLSYSLHVQPQPWLPVRLIQGRIEGEIKNNLRAVRGYSEQQWSSGLL